MDGITPERVVRRPFDLAGSIVHPDERRYASADDSPPTKTDPHRQLADSAGVLKFSGWAPRTTHPGGWHGIFHTA